MDVDNRFKKNYKDKSKILLLLLYLSARAFSLARWPDLFFIRLERTVGMYGTVLYCRDFCDGCDENVRLCCVVEKENFGIGWTSFGFSRYISLI